jgi:hypothetical protein
MKKNLAKFLSGVAAFGIAMSAWSLTIVPTFDGSITNDPNGAAMTNAINAAIQVLQANIADNFTVYIHYTNDASVGLGQSQTWGGNYSYTQYLAALKNSAADINDTNAISQLPNSTTDPVIGGKKIYLTLALARRMGLDTGEGPDGFDSTVSLNMAFMNFTRPPGDTNKYDLQTTVEHEDDEILGTSSGLPAPSPIWAMDLFRYTTNLARTFTTNGDNAYFSVDGTNLLARFNMDTNGDFGDWWSVNGTNRWAPPGVTPRAQVQDAFGSPGTFQDLGANELAMLDAVGWTLSVTTPQIPPVLNIARSGANQFTLSWTNTAASYVLQERTNLTSGSWVASVSGSTNPAVIVSASGGKFYRLSNVAAPSPPTAQTVAAQPSKNTSLQLVIRTYKPGQH